MNHLSDKQLQELKRGLVEERKKLQAHFEMQEADRPSLRASSGELSAYDNHPADIGTETFERSRDMALDRSLDEQLQQVEAALERIRSGAYGKCEVCGCDIPFERLQAIPFTTYCVEHAQEARSYEMERRPIEEQVMTPPASGAGANRQRNAGKFDDADAWKTLESFGNSDSPAMAAERDAEYESLSSYKVDRLGSVEALEAFTGNDMQGKQRHVQQTKLYKKYMEHEEGERRADKVESEAKKR